MAGTLMLIVVLMLIMLNTVPLLTAENLIFASKQDSLIQRANRYADIVSVLSDEASLNRTNVSVLMQNMSVAKNSRVLIVNSSNAVVYDSSDVNSRMDEIFVMEGRNSALLGNNVFISRYENKCFYSHTIVPIYYIGDKTPVLTGLVCIYEQDAEQALLLRNTQRNLFLFSLFALCGSLVICIVLYLYLSRRIQLLYEGIAKMREGKYRHIVSIPGNDEFSDIGREFNNLSGRLEQTETLRRQFISDASHEFKTPLASITLMADSIIENPSIRREDLLDFVTDIKKESERLARISEKLLMLSKLESVYDATDSITNLNVVVKRAAKLLDPVCHKLGGRIRLEMEEDCTSPGDEDIFYQIVINLLENAIKYNRKGGLVTLLLFHKENMIHFIIDDEGPGISVEDEKRIFERFFRVDSDRSRETGGTGLGLAIVRKAADLLGAQISFENRSMGGCRFIVVFRSAQLKEGTQ